MRVRASVVAAGLALLLGACGAGPSSVASHASPSTRAPGPSPFQPPSPSPIGSPSPFPPGPSAASLPPNLVGVDLERLPTSRKVVALTFDAGAGAQGVPKILAALHNAGVPGTFFLTGRWVQAFPVQAAQIAAVRIDTIGNHTYQHPHLPLLPRPQVEYQVLHAAGLIQAATGRNPQPLFRFPYGDRNPTLIGWVNQLGYVSVRWTVDTLGWEGQSAGQSVASVRQRVMAKLQPGEIVLMHMGASPDGSTLDADALPGVIAAIRAAGYDFVGVWEFV